jgi:pyruvate kinase
MKIIRDLNSEYGYTTAILGDLQGPKPLVLWMKGFVILGDLITFTTAEDILGTAQKCSWNIKLSNDVNTGEKILLDDGKLILKLLKQIKTRK